MGIVFYTNWFVPKTAAGCARAIFIFIRPKYINDIGLLAHERTHVRQFLRLPFIHSFLYLLNSKYRYNCEVEAYGRQLQVNGDRSRTMLYAEFICNYYKLDVDYDATVLDLLDAAGFDGP